MPNATTPGWAPHCCFGPRAIVVVINLF